MAMTPRKVAPFSFDRRAFCSALRGGADWAWVISLTISGLNHQHLMGFTIGISGEFLSAGDVSDRNWRVNLSKFAFKTLG
ncbi:hypothetical protein AAX10_07490 [Moraxella bovoculi]|nr:hypothetical protein AAX10_07490 [Moraxella bovoculi]